MNSGVHDAFNLFEKLEPVLKGEKARDTLALFDRQRRTVTHSFTQTQTIANMEFIKSANADSHEQKRQAMLEIKQDDAKRRAYLLRQSMYESLEEAAAID